ncbi:MAG: hypothetical protein IPI67_11235 [Myxococcales bacterium]|nr:hypothetical protein [Myxococcales bacterium]
MHFVAFGMGIVLLVCGCGSGGSSGALPDASTENDGGTESGTAEDAGPGSACTRFVTCSLKAQPATAAATLAAYGPDGACWKSQTQMTCEEACRNGIVALHQLAPSEPACAVCVSDQDCSGSTPVCNPVTAACAQCKGPAECSAPLPACDVATGTCVACASAADCSAPLPACDTASHSCVECVSGAECSSGTCQGDNTCCVATDPCSASSCSTAYDNCGKSVNCGNCPSGQFCNSSSFCEATSDSFACNAGGTNNTCKKYLQYCQYYFNGPGGTTAWCSPMPAACQANPTCACLTSAGKLYPPDTCAPNTGPDGAGVLYVTSKP